MFIVNQQTESSSASSGAGDTPLSITSIHILPDNEVFNLGINGKYTALNQYNVMINKYVYWTSSDPTIVEVNAITGEATSKALGTVTITATLITDGSIVGTTTTEIVPVAIINGFHAELLCSVTGDTNIKLFSNGPLDMTIDFGSGPVTYTGYVSGSPITANVTAGETVIIDVPDNFNYVMNPQFTGGSQLIGDIFSEVDITKSSSVTDMNMVCYYMTNLTAFAVDDNAGVTNMKMAFENCSSLTVIPGFDVLTVTDSTSMFSGCSVLDNIPTFTFSALLTAKEMFKGCANLKQFNAPSLATLTVTNMYGTFQDCSSLVTIPTFETSSVTNMDYTFSGCSSLTDIPLLSTQEATTMNYTFQGCTNLATLATLDTGKVISMTNTFQDCSSLVVMPLLNTINVTTLADAWSGCNTLEYFPAIDTSKVTDFSYAWNLCDKLLEFPALDFTNGLDFTRTFNECLLLQAMPLLDTVKGNVFDSMFMNCEELVCLTELDTRVDTSTADLFTNTPLLTSPDLTEQQLLTVVPGVKYVNPSPCTVAITSITITPDDGSFIVGVVGDYKAYSQSGVDITDKVTWSSGNVAIVTIDSVTGEATAVLDGTTTIDCFLIADPLITATTDVTITLTSMAFHAELLVSVSSNTNFRLYTTGNIDFTVDYGDGVGPVDYLDYISGTIISEPMIAGNTMIIDVLDQTYSVSNPQFTASSNTIGYHFTTVDITKSSSVTDASNMCYYLDKLTSFTIDDASNITNFTNMFSYCYDLTTIPLFDTSSGVDFIYMFGYCTALTTIPLFDTSSGTDFTHMFIGCNLLDNIPTLDTSSGTDFVGMFSDCTSLVVTPTLDVSNGTSFYRMYNGCTSLVTVADMNTSIGTTFYEMFQDCSSLVCLTTLDTSLSTVSTDLFDGCILLTSPDATEQIDLAAIPGTNYINPTPCTTTTTSMTIKPDDGKYNVGTTGDYKAYNQSGVDITSLVTWSTDDALTVEIDTVTGAAEGMKVGTTVIRCELISDPLIIANTDVEITITTMAFHAELLCNTSGNTNFHLVTTGTLDMTVDFGSGPVAYNSYSSYSVISEPISAGKTLIIDVPEQINNVAQVRFTAATTSGDLFSSVDITKSSSLTSAFVMCSEMSKLTSFSIADSTNITNFQNMFANCNLLPAVTNIDTANGTIFNSMFKGCSSLESIDAIVTSTGSNFDSMLEGCSSLVCLSSIDTTNATTSTDMFTGCTSLVAPDSAEQTQITNIPGIDWVNVNPCPTATTAFHAELLCSVSGNTIGITLYTTGTMDITIDEGAGSGPIPYTINSGNNKFIDIIIGNTIIIDAPVQTHRVTHMKKLDNKYSEVNITKSSSLTSLGNLCENMTELTTFNMNDSSNVTDFNSAWKDCSSLTSFPSIDTSSGTNFRNTWFACSSLTSFPSIDTSSGTTFQSAWAGCSALASFPLLDTSSVTSFHQAWSNCYSLTSFPSIDTSSGTNFGSTWSNCSNLACLTNVDTRLSIDSDYMFDYCPSLIAPNSTEQTQIEAIPGINWVNPNPCP